MGNPQRRMTFGIQPTGWTNDDFPEIGNDCPYEVILDQTRQAGFEGGSTGHNYPRHLPSLRHAMECRGLKIASTWCGTSFSTGVNADAAFGDFQAQVSFLQDVGAHDVVVAELANAVNQVRTKAVLADRPTLTESEWFLLIQLLERAGKYAKDRGMQLSYHPHVGTCVMTVSETQRLLDSTGPDCVGLCLDTAHLCYGGATQSEIVDLTKQYADRITHVHLKNVRGSIRSVAVNKNYSFYEAIESGIFTVPGDPQGELDLRPILEILQDAGYSGWMVVEAEQDPALVDPSAHKHITPLEYAQMARTYLHNCLGY